MRRTWTLRILGPVVAVVAVAGLLASPAEAAKRPFCGQAWGARPKQLGANDPGPALLRSVRSSSGACYDRLVLEVDGPVTAYRVEYVGRVATDGQDEFLALRGGAFLALVFGGRTYDDRGRPTYAPADRNNVVDVRTYPTFRQVAFGSSFEAVTIFGVGVRAVLPFRVLVVPGPGSHNRIVLDVSHRWI